MEIGKNKLSHYMGLCICESCFERSEWDLEWDLEMEFRVFESVYVNLANCQSPRPLAWGIKGGQRPHRS